MINGVMIMKKRASKVRKAVGLAAAAVFFVLCLFDNDGTSAAVRDGVRRCLDIVIPSLFAMMTASALIVSSGLTTAVPRCVGRFSRAVFGMEGRELPIFTFGMVAGYPVGVKMLCGEYLSGRITKRRAELLSGLCFGAGPAFIFGCISGQLYGSRRAGLLILVSTVSANVILALFMTPILRRTASAEHKPCRVSISADMLTDCVLRSGRAMGEICAMIVFFSVAAHFLTAAFGAAAVELPWKLHCLGGHTAEAPIAAFLDVTNVAGFPRGDWLLLPLISGLTAFGGICVFMQLAAVTHGKLSLLPFIIMRAAAAVMSYFICRGLLPLFIEGEFTEVSSIRAESTRSVSPVPSVMLIIMTVALMLEFGSKKAAYGTENYTK